ncbi:hypothetical protein V8F20_008060 [Naviculisporaceae sp. PSN 640]
MQRNSDDYSEGYTAPVFGQWNASQGVQQFGFRTDHDELQRPASRFLPPTKSYDTVTPPFSPSFPTPSPFPESHSRGLPPSRGASPSPANTIQSQTASVFSAHSSVSSTSTHPSSSLLSLCGGRESPSPGSAPHYRAQSPLAWNSSPYNRPPTRNHGRPGSPLARHPSLLHSAGVARPASRRSNRLGPLSSDHQLYQIVQHMNSQIAPSGNTPESFHNDQNVTPWDEGHAPVRYGVYEEEPASLCSEMIDAPDAAPQHPTECHAAQSPASQSSQDAATMTGLSDSNATSPRSPEDEHLVSERAIRVLRTILGDEFDLRLGTFQPPPDMVSAGYVVPLQTITVHTDTSETSSPASSGAGPAGGQRPQAPKKRGASDSRRADQDGSHDGDEDDDGDDDGGAACNGPLDAVDRKKPRLDLYPCPFRKRNPIRFNVREWMYCSKAPFKGITELKKHLIRCHQQEQFTCRCDRCNERFASRDDLSAHLRQDRICDIRDREGSPLASRGEAVSITVGERFRSRAEHFDWKSIWLALFPEDDPDDIPNPDFEPPVELHEVVREFKDSLPDLQSKLAAAFAPSGHSELGQIAEEVLEEVMGEVFARARIQAIAGVHGALTGASFCRPQPRLPADPPNPSILRTNSGTPSSHTTSSSGVARHNLRPRTGVRSVAETSGASTPSSQFRNSPVGVTRTSATSPNARSLRTTGSSFYYPHAQSPTLSQHSSSPLLSASQSSSFRGTPLSASASEGIPSMSSTLFAGLETAPQFQFLNQNAVGYSLTDRQPSLALQLQPQPSPRSSRSQQGGPYRAQPPGEIFHQDTSYGRLNNAHIQGGVAIPTRAHAAMHSQIPTPWNSSAHVPTLGLPSASPNWTVHSINDINRLVSSPSNTSGSGSNASGSLLNTDLSSFEQALFDEFLQKDPG